MKGEKVLYLAHSNETAPNRHYAQALRIRCFEVILLDRKDSHRNEIALKAHDNGGIDLIIIDLDSPLITKFWDSSLESILETAATKLSNVPIIYLASGSLAPEDYGLVPNDNHLFLRLNDYPPFECAERASDFLEALSTAS